MRMYYAVAASGDQFILQHNTDCNEYVGDECMSQNTCVSIYCKIQYLKQGKFAASYLEYILDMMTSTKQLSTNIPYINPKKKTHAHKKQLLLFIQ